MFNKSKNHKQPFTISFKNHKITVTKPQLELATLIILLISVVAAQLSGLYPYVYNYARCHDAPLEVRGAYYRIPYDNGYGIHPGSDYSRCFDGMPTDLKRDPSTAAGAKLLKSSRDLTDFSGSADGYTTYVPKDHNFTHLGKSGQPGYFETTYTTSAKNVEFRVREMKKDSAMSYTNLCSKAPEDSWYGEIAGTDTAGRQICRAHSSYIQDYIVGINIDNTAIMLQTSLDKPVADLNAAAAIVFSSMQPYGR